MLLESNNGGLRPAGDLGALAPAAASGHVGVAAAALLQVAVLPRRHAFAPLTARHARSHAHFLPRVQLAPHRAWRRALCTFPTARTIVLVSYIHKNYT